MPHGKRDKRLCDMKQGTKYLLFKAVMSQKISVGNMPYLKFPLLYKHQP